MRPVPRPQGRGGAPRRWGTMRRIACLQHWFNRSDPQAEAMRDDSRAMRHFARIDPRQDRLTVAGTARRQRCRCRPAAAETGVATRVTVADRVPHPPPCVVVVLHGFSAMRQETAPLSEEVAPAQGATLFETRLQGDGLPGDPLGVAGRQRAAGRRRGGGARHATERGSRAHAAVRARQRPGGGRHADRGVGGASACGEPVGADEGGARGAARR